MVALAKYGSVSLTEASPSLSELKVVVCWPKQDQEASEVDLTCLMLAASGKVRDNSAPVSSESRISFDGSVMYLGHNAGFTEIKELDTAAIKIDLPKVSSDISQLVFAVSVGPVTKLGQTFAQLSNVLVCLTNDYSDRVLATYELDQVASGCKCVVLGELYRATSAWGFRAIGECSFETRESWWAKYRVNVTKEPSLALEMADDTSKQSTASSSSGSSTYRFSDTDEPSKNLSTNTTLDASASASKRSGLLGSFWTKAIACGLILCVGFYIFNAVSGLDHVRVGMGWDRNYLFGNEFDLDVRYYMYTQSGDSVELAPNGAIKISSVSSTGVNSGDDEVLEFSLSKMSPEVERVVITTTIFRGKALQQSFNQVANAYINIVDVDSGKTLTSYDLSASSGICRNMVAGEFYRDSSSGEWKFRDIGQCF